MVNKGDFQMNKIFLILVASIIVISAIGVPIYLTSNQNNGNPDLRVTLKSCGYNAYYEEYDLHTFTVVIHVKPIRFTDRNQFHILYANITDGNEQKQIKAQSINRNYTAEDYTYLFGFSLREINEPVELTIQFSISETDLTGASGLAVPIFSKTLTLHPKIVPIEEIKPENEANVEIQFLYNTSISDYDRVNLTLFSQDSGIGVLEIYFSTYENFSTGVAGIYFKDVYLEKGGNTLILPRQNLCIQFLKYKNDYLTICHLKESLESETLASGLMPKIKYEDIPNT